MTALSEWESKRALGPDLPLPREVRSRTLEEAVSFTRDLHRPAVAKASGVAHKSDRGLVRVGLDPEGVAACWAELAAAGDGTVMVAERVIGDLELIAGGLRDPQFGPVVMVGLGGVLAEVIDDTAFVLAPPEPGELDRALARLRAAPLLDGYRGVTPPDRAELHAIVASVSDLLVRDPRVVAVDLNPIVVRDGHPLVLDALVVVDEATDGGVT